MKRADSRYPIADLAPRLGLSDDQVAREILQARILSALFHGRTRQLILKGGLAMRQVHDSGRLTKDIDLSAVAGSSMAAIAKTVEEAIDMALQSGLLDDVKVTAPKQTEATQRWKVNGRITGGESLVQLTIEVSRRGAPPDEYVESMEVMSAAEYDAAPVVVQVFKPIALAAGKVAALTDPKREAPRDVYDLDLLISMRVDPPVKLLAGMGSGAIGRALDHLWGKLELMDWKRARSELRNFLPLPTLEALDEEEWETMRLRVGTEVEKWLHEAMRLAEGDQS